MESSCWFHISWNHGYSRKIRFTLFCSILVTKNSVLLSVTFEHKVSVSWKESSSSAAFIPYFFQSSSLPLPHSLPFPFEDSSLWNCLQFYGLNRIFRCFFGKYFHLKLSKGSCTLISIFAGHPHLGFLQASQIQPIWGGRYLCTLDQYLSQIIPILPVTRGQTPLLILPAISCPLLLILRTWSIPLLSALQKPCFSSLLLWICGMVLVFYLACPLPASLIHSPSYILLPDSFHSSKSQGPACHGQVHAGQFKISPTLPRVAGHSSLPPFRFTHSACMSAQSLLSCHTLCNTMGYNPPGSSVHWFSR